MKECADPARVLLVFHANGKLDDEDRRRVESHLGGCDDCRELLELARGARGEAEGGDFYPLDHVQSQLLTEYVDRPESLDEETRSWVGSHLEGCDECRSVVPVLHQVPGASGERLSVERPVSMTSRLWDFLGNTILAPVPAMAWLVLVLAGLVWIAWTGGPAPLEENHVQILPAPSPVFGDLPVRSGRSAPEPLRLEISGDALLRLALHTDLDPEDTAPGAPGMRLALKRDDEVLWSAAVDPATIPPDGVLEVAMRSGSLPLRTPLQIVLLAEGSEQAPLFTRTIIVSSSAQRP